jgi:hypothetical protein
MAQAERVSEQRRPQQHRVAWGKQKEGGDPNGDVRADQERVNGYYLASRGIRHETAIRVLENPQLHSRFFVNKYRSSEAKRSCSAREPFCYRTAMTASFLDGPSAFALARDAPTTLYDWMCQEPARKVQLMANTTEAASNHKSFSSLVMWIEISLSADNGFEC